MVAHLRDGEAPVASDDRQGGSDLFLSSQTHKLMAATKFSDYLGPKDYKKGKKLKYFIHLRLAYRPQSFGS